MAAIVLAIVIHEQRVLVIRRARQDREVPNLICALPGGKPETGESLEQAVIREVKEETGLTVCIRALLCERTIPGTGISACYYQCNWVADSTTTPIPNGNEVIECRWASGKQALALFTSNVAQPVRDVLVAL